MGTFDRQLGRPDGSNGCRIAGIRRSLEALTMRRFSAICTALLALMIAASGIAPAAAAPEGQVTWGIHISLAPTWFDPAETTGIVTPFMVLYALHDAVVKPMP